MKILVVSTHDFRGGAGKASYRFGLEFVKKGHYVCLYVRDQQKEDKFIRKSETRSFLSKVFHVLDYGPGYVLSGFNSDTSFTLGLFGESLDKVIEDFKPDIINIHWTWKGFVSFPHICNISKKIPVVWIMHDYSAFSDGVFYPQGTENVLLRGLVKVNKYIRKIFLRNANITFVASSRFLQEEFERTELAEKFKNTVINNGVSVDIFKKGSKAGSRRERGLDQKKKYILFGAVNIVDSGVKGGDVLKKVFKNLSKYLVENNIGVISFGSKDPFEFLDMDKRIEQIHMGYIRTDEELAKLFACADVMLVPSKQENYPFIILESLACGIPVIAFKVGGIPEIINHKGDGYLVDAFSVDEYANGIKYVLENKLPMEHTVDYDMRNKAKECLNLFEEVLTE